MRVTDAQTGLQMVLAINSQLAVLTSSLLQLYSLADSRVAKLAVTLRCWAKVSFWSLLFGRVVGFVCLFVLTKGTDWLIFFFLTEKLAFSLLLLRESIK